MENNQEQTPLLQPGTQAPDFSLPSTPDQKITLSEFRGRPVVLVFYPADWSPVCSDQLSHYNEILPYLKKHNAALLGISVDGSWCHVAYTKERKVQFPLLADFEPKGKVAKDYGAYDEENGTCSRSLFVIDPEGRIAWSYRSPTGINPGSEGILQALDALAEKRASKPEETRAP